MTGIDGLMASFRGTENYQVYSGISPTSVF